MRGLLLSLFAGSALASAHASFRSLKLRGTAGITKDDPASAPPYHVVRLTHKQHPNPARHDIRKRRGSDMAGVEVLTQYTQARAYFAQLNFNGQLIDVHVDTGSSDLLVPSETQHVDILEPSSPQRLNLTAAGARLVSCEEAACNGYCTYDLISSYSERLFCGPHGGVCASAEWFSGAMELNNQHGAAANATPNVCLFYDGYGDGSYTVGFVVESEVEFGGYKVKARFGAIDATGNQFYFIPQGGGIMGLAFPEMRCNDFSCFPSLFNTLVADPASNVKDVFAICGGNTEEPFNGEGPLPPISPLLLLGGGDSRLYIGAITYVPMVKPFYYYQVDVFDVKVGDGAGMTSLYDSIMPPPMTIDTGTAAVVLPSMVYDNFKAHLQEHYCHIPSVCGRSGQTIFDGGDFYDPDSEFASLPSLHVVLSEKDDFALELSPRQYMGRWFDEGTGETGYGLSILRAEDDYGIIGEVLLDKYYLEFDKVKRRMGFATSVADCAGAIGSEEDSN